MSCHNCLPSWRSFMQFNWTEIPNAYLRARTICKYYCFKQHFFSYFCNISLMVIYNKIDWLIDWPCPDIFCLVLCCCLNFFYIKKCWLSYPTIDVRNGKVRYSLSLYETVHSHTHTPTHARTRTNIHVHIHTGKHTCIRDYYNEKAYQKTDRHSFTPSRQ